jgi:predicted membrane-bound spermidine synthase
VTRSPMAPAIAGALGIALTSILSLVTNRAENNFLPGIVINSVMLLVLVISIAVRWPLVGVLIGMLMGDTEWRADKIKRRALTLATWIWVLPSAIRVAIQVPLYLIERADLLAATKLLTGIPLYLAALWVTWLLVRAVYHKPVASL